MFIVLNPRVQHQIIIRFYLLGTHKRIGCGFKCDITISILTVSGTIKTVHIRVILFLYLLLSLLKRAMSHFTPNYLLCILYLNKICLIQSPYFRSGSVQGFRGPLGESSPACTGATWAKCRRPGS